ncbi:mechanosensitive ion channel family protein, partial [bacterium]|nr:mechanosensitive ion channel family protein [candidate division CSSED10-310 bacterium]
KMSLSEYLHFDVYGIELYKIVLSFLCLLSALFVKVVFNQAVIPLFHKFAKRTKSTYDDLLVEALHKPLNAVIYVTGIYYAIIVLSLPSEPYNFPRFFYSTYRIAISLITVWAIYRLSNLLATFLRRIISKADHEMAEVFAPLITQALRVTILIIGVLLIIQNLGYSVGSLLAGLGIGGLAVALAAQDTISNLFGTFVMIADRPFKVGDWVQFRDIDGNVESIGFRSTKIRTWSKSLKILPNKLLTSEIIENWSEMPKRRVKMNLGITYDSSPEKICLLRDSMERILAEDPDVDQDYYLVYFTDFGPSSLDFFVYYFTKSTVWKEYLAVRQRINIKFINAVRELGLSFAFPSQSVYFGDQLQLANPVSDSLK